MEKLTLTGYLETLVNQYLSIEKTEEIDEKKVTNESQILDTVSQLEKDFMDLMQNPEKEK